MRPHSSDHRRSGKGNVQIGLYSVLYDDDMDEKAFYDRTTNVADEKPTLLSTSTDMIMHKSISHQDHKHHQFYKPTSNRTWVLACFLFALGLCILLLELAVSTHPDSRLVLKLSSSDVALHMRDIVEQQEQVLGSTSMTVGGPNLSVARSRLLESFPEITPTVARCTTTRRRKTHNARQEDATTGTTHTTTAAEQPTITPTTSQVIDDHVSVPSTTEVTVGEPYRGDQLSNTEPTTEKPTTTREAENFTGQPIQSSQMTITSPDQSNSKITVGHPPSESQMSITAPGQSTSKGTVSQPPSESQVSSQDPMSPATDSNAISSMTHIGAPSATAAVSSSQGGEFSAIADASTPVASIAPVASIVSGSLIAFESSILGTIKPQNRNTASAAVLGVATLTNGYGIATATLSFTGSAVLADASGRATRIVSYIASPVTRSSSEVTTTATATKDDASPGKEKVDEFTQSTYFMAMYMPIIIGAALQSAWLVVFATFKMMEPFYQLATTEGALAHATLTAGLPVHGSFSFLRKGGFR